MTLLYTSPRFLDHNTGSHPENATRLQYILAYLQSYGLQAKCIQPTTWDPVARSILEQIHEPAMIRSLESLAENGGGMADPDTIVGATSVTVAKLAAGALCDATGRVVRGEDKRALCLVRPPGHHALRNHSMGFCLFNNVALATAAALKQGLERVLIVDWDVHHGNGTQAIFYSDPRVGFFSVHRWPFYPGTGAPDETGTGAGRGATRNLPLEFGISRRDYQSAVLRELEGFAAHIRPELVLVSAGFDAHRLDPVGSLGLEVEDFQWLSEAVVDVANTYAQGRLVSTLEGGYNPAILAECVGTHLRVLLEHD
jgi:acetoin utilization deacetylase AcuC-like enzyme